MKLFKNTFEESKRTLELPTTTSPTKPKIVTRPKSCDKNVTTTTTTTTTTSSASSTNTTAIISPENLETKNASSLVNEGQAISECGDVIDKVLNDGLLSDQISQPTELTTVMNSEVILNNNNENNIDNNNDNNVQVDSEEEKEEEWTKDHESVGWKVAAEFPVG